jgi:CheY-like chemotaxis protein/anti-sigma regulatory factor (Ser/Thr protein kinase)
MKRVLVVEDNANQRAGLCRLLEHAGYEVKSAADGVEALEKLQQKEFELLLVDVWMPRMNGLELLAQLAGASRPKALVMTADDTAEIVLQALHERAYLTIEKPFDPVSLLQIIASALESPPLQEDIHVVSAQPNWVELRFPCEMETAGRVENVVQRLNSHLPTQIRQSVNLAFHELLMNAVEWGGHLNPALQAQIDYLRTDKFLMCRIADPGCGFNPDETKDVTINLHPEDPFAHDERRKEKEMRPGGFGIRLAKSLVDELVYNEPHNEVVMVKYLNGRYS